MQFSSFLRHRNRVFAYNDFLDWTHWVGLDLGAFFFLYIQSIIKSMYICVVNDLARIKVGLCINIVFSSIAA
jgi:hypothetical protein